MAHLYYFYFLQILVIISTTNCERILVVIPTPSYSHVMVLRTVYKELSLRGHEVVAFTPNPLNDAGLTNLTEIDLGFFYERTKDAPYEKFFTFYKMGLVAAIQDVLLKISREIFKHPDMKRIINDSKEHFDLLLVEWNVNPSFTVLSRRFDCPMVGMRSLGLRLEGHDSVGNPTNPSYIPVAYMDFEESFWGRLDNFLTSIMWRLHYHWFIVPEAQQIADEFLPNYSGNILEIQENVSIILTNTHPIITGVRPLVPAIIEMGGIHLRREKQEIPMDIQEFLDWSKKGVVYFNLGSQVQTANLDPAILKVIISALSELPYNVLWKWENDALSDLPLNCKVRKWLPQEEILAHPKVEAFISHGGLTSVYEAVDNLVPLILIPFYADQHANARRLEKLGIGKMLDIQSLEKNSFVNTVKTVIQDPLYKRNIEFVAFVLHDLPMKPMDNAIWWIEYVLRNKGAPHLRSPAIDMNWVTYLLLDVIALFLIVLMIFIYISYRIIKYVWSLFKRKFCKAKMC